MKTDEIRPKGILNVEGQRCEVIENLGRQGGYRARVVRDPQGNDRIAVLKEDLHWHFWTVADRLN